MGGTLGRAEWKGKQQQKIATTPFFFSFLSSSFLNSVSNLVTKLKMHRWGASGRRRTRKGGKWEIMTSCIPVYSFCFLLKYFTRCWEVAHCSEKEKMLRAIAWQVQLLVQRVISFSLLLQSHKVKRKKNLEISLAPSSSSLVFIIILYFFF